MNKEIKYNGFSTSPSDYECNDGDLATSINIVHEDGTLKPILPPKVIFAAEEGLEAIYIHKCLNYENYILYGENDMLYWKDGKEGDTVQIRQVYGLKKIISSGNVLVISGSDGISYFLFKDGTYIYMGDGIPSFPVYFSMNGESRMEAYTDTGIQVQRSGGGTTTTEGEETLIFEQEIWAYSNGGATYVDVEIQSGERYNFFHKFFNAASPDFEVYYVEPNGTETLWIKVTGSQYKNLLAEKTCSRLKICLFFLSGTSGSAVIQIFHKEFIITTDPVVITFNKSLENFNAIMTTCNRFIASCHTDDKFIFPFYVRYALVLYDGTEAQVSPPILMIPNYKKIPFLPYRFTYTSGSDITVHAFAVACGLRMHILPNELSSWSDIVSGVNIYATSPLFTYNQAATYEEWSSNMNISQTDSIPLETLYSVSSEKGSFVGKSITERYNTFVGNLPNSYVDIPIKPDDDIHKSLHANQVYRKIKSYTIDEIIRLTSDDKEVVVDIELEKGTLNSINSLPEFSGTSYVFNKMYPSDIFSYNNRLIVSTNSERMFEGYDPCELNGYYDDGSRGVYSVDVYVKNKKNDAIVKTVKINRLRPYIPIYWFYYPNSNAFKAVISRWVYNDGKYQRNGQREIKLIPHDYLPGAYWQQFQELTFTDEAFEEMDDSQIKEYLQPLSESVSKIQVSEVNNPFVFNPANTVTIGFGEILALSAAVRALSQGQFGQFPLYAFSTEGVWALEVSSTGTFSAKQPVTRDVCINADGITQLDNAVLFPTDRGIMLISGSQTQCISESINSEYPFNALDLPGFDKLHDMLGHDPVTDKCLPTLPFTEFLKQCRMIYDYVHQRVIVYAPNITYVYVFSLKSKLWGMTFSNIASHLNSYPEALAVDKENNIVNFSESDETQVKCLYVTRPLKLDTVNIHKTIDSIIQRGFFRKGNVATALYGSRDMVNWYLIWSSRDHYLRGFRGTPYKYFRIAGVATLDADESIYGASVQFTPRLTNQPR